MRWRFTTASNRCCGGSLHFQSNPLRLDPKSPAFFASPRGGVGPSYLHKRCHSIIFAGQLAGVRGAGWVGRRLCRPPAGGGVGAPLPGRWGRECGALSPKAPRKVRPARRSEPYRKRAGGGNGRLGDRGPTGGGSGPDGPLAYRVAAQVAAVFRGWLGILRDWGCGLLGGASS